MSLGADPKVNAPNPGQVGSNFEQLLNQLYASAPGQLQQQANLAPAYTMLGNTNLNTELNGGNGGPGLVDLYTGTVPQISGAQTGANENLAEGNINNLLTLGPAAAQGEAAINPSLSALENNITGTANKQLDLGTELDPSTVNQTLNTVNTNWSNRGMGGQPGNELSDALSLYAGGQNLLGTRESQAENAASTAYSTQAGPLTNLLTPTSTAPNLGLSLTGAGQSVSSNAGPTLYKTADLESLMNTVYNQQAAANISQANDEAAITSAIIGGMSNMGGSMMSE